MSEAAGKSQRQLAQETHDLLGYGTQLVLDGRAADAGVLASQDRVATFVTAVLDQIEADAGEGADGGTLARLQVAKENHDNGISAVVSRGETTVMLHTFSDVGRITLRLVSARSVPVDLVMNEFKNTFVVGRYQSHVTARFRAFPKDGAQLERLLVGERAYARLRLSEPFLP